MLAAIVFASVCLHHSNNAACVPEEVIASVGAQLLLRASPDFTEVEQAAFLTRNDDGSVGCRMWPLTGEREASTYRGTLPRNTIAIIHTHPHDWFKPSPGDEALSVRLDLPVLVVTRHFVSRVDPDGTRARWVRFSGGGSPVCEPVAQ